MTPPDDQVAHITLIGPNLLQNELLAKRLETELSLACFWCIRPSLLSPAAKAKKGTHLLLFDWLGQDATTYWPDFDLQTLNRGQQYIAFFNVPYKSCTEKKALQQGIRGIFYDNESVAVLLKGILAILQGDLWYSRDMLSHFFVEQPSLLNGADTLTTREKEILVNIASGFTNQEIADTLFISLHTVKTHLYNIYRKINVPNRLQATLWVAKYL
jgi:DNA-binding CsgD family transcriptional regulator